MKKIFFLFAVLLYSEIYAEQSIQQNIVVVFDDSMSMSNRFGKSSRMEVAKESLSRQLEQLPKNTNLGIITLNGLQTEEKWFVPFGPLDAKAAVANVKKIVPVGNTPLGACMKNGCDILLAKRAKQKYGVYRLLIITDGEASDPNLVDRYLPDIMKRNVFVDVIGIDMQTNHALANRVSTYMKANDTKQLTAALKTTLAEVSYKDSSAAEKDFKMLEGLPDDVSKKVIEGLSEFENHPIGERPPVPVKTSSNDTTSNSTNSGGVPTVVKWVLGVCCCVFFGFILLAVICGDH